MAPSNYFSLGESSWGIPTSASLMHDIHPTFFLSIDLMEAIWKVMMMFVFVGNSNRWIICELFKYDDDDD